MGRMLSPEEIKSMMLSPEEINSILDGNYVKEKNFGAENDSIIDIEDENEVDPSQERKSSTTEYREMIDLVNVEEFRAILISVEEKMKQIDNLFDEINSLIDVLKVIIK